jgi:hypothetical protein
MESQTQIKFIPGRMDRFISMKAFTLGGTNYSVYVGMELLFDGTNVELNGDRFTLPSLRGAIRTRWVVPAGDYDPEAIPTGNPSANIGVRSANDLGQNPLSPAKKSAIVTIESDERVVMNCSERTQQANQHTVEARQSQGRAGAFVARGSSSELVGGAEFGVEIGRAFQTSAKTGMQLNPNNVGTAIRDAELVKINPGEGISEGEMLSKMTAEEQAQYLAKKEAHKSDIQSRTPGYILPTVVTTNLASMNQPGMKSEAQPKVMLASDNQVIGRVAPTQTKVREGISVGLTSGGGIDTFDASGSTESAKESVVEQEGMVFRNTNGPKTGFRKQPVSSEPQTSILPVDVDSSQSRIETDGTADYRKMIAKSLCPDFPMDYSFSDHWKKRLARIRLNYEDRPDIIRAIFAAESDEFKKLILAEFSEVFSALPLKSD